MNGGLSNFFPSLAAIPGLLLPAPPKLILLASPNASLALSLMSAGLSHVFLFSGDLLILELRGHIASAITVEKGIYVSEGSPCQTRIWRIGLNLYDANPGHLRMGRIDEDVFFGRHNHRGKAKEEAFF